MRAVGTHSYLGGMLLGARDAGIDVLASRESWEPAVAAQPLMGLNTIAFDSQVPRADIVIGNPPCARFSTMATHKYSGAQKGGLADFDELKDLVGTMDLTGARALWWETGPLLWSKGHDMVQSVQDYYAAKWGKATTVVLRVEARHVGISQRRPRCHVITFKGDKSKQLPYLPGYAVPPPVGVFFEDRVDDVLDQPIPYAAKKVDVSTPEKVLEWATWQNQHSTYHATKPVVIDPRDNHTPAVVSAKPFVWSDGRWFDLMEYGALMGLSQGLRAVGEKMGLYGAQVLVSKGVSANVSKWVADCLVKPLMGGLYGMIDSRNYVAPAQRAPGIYTYDAVPRQVKRQGWLEGVTA